MFIFIETTPMPLLMNEFVVYFLKSKSNTSKTYVGFTSDLINRVKSHNFLSEKGYTRNFRPWEVIYLEFYTSKADAMKREKVLKTGVGREFLKQVLLELE